MLIRIASLALTFIAVSLSGAQSAYAEDCGRGAIEIGRTETDKKVILTCKCAEGFLPFNGACVTRDFLLNLVAEKITAEQAANQAGMLLRHVEGLTKFAQGNHLLMMFRATNKASVKFFNNPDFIAKPESIKDEKSAKQEPYAGYVVDNTGEPIKIDGKFVHADYDMQGVYKLENNNFAKYYTDPFHPINEQLTMNGGTTFVNRLNNTVFRDHPMIMHGADDSFTGIRDKDFSKLRTLRDPSDKFLVIEPSGAKRIIDGAANLSIYYGLNGINWPYEP